MSFPHKAIQQICRQYAIIDTHSNEWLFDAPKYSECVSKVVEVVPAGREYVIVAVLKQAVRPQPQPYRFMEPIFGKPCPTKNPKKQNENKTNRNHPPRSSGGG